MRSINFLLTYLCHLCQLFYDSNHITVFHMGKKLKFTRESIMHRNKTLTFFPARWHHDADLVHKCDKMASMPVTCTNTLIWYKTNNKYTNMNAVRQYILNAMVVCKKHIFTYASLGALYLRCHSNLNSGSSSSFYFKQIHASYTLAAISTSNWHQYRLSFGHK